MKRFASFAAVGTLVGLVGCTLPQMATRIPPVGPAPTASSTGLREGALQVYSAPKPARLDPEMAERLWDENSGGNDFKYSHVHTDYAIYSVQGRLLQQVHNASAAEYAQPALVRLPSGRYSLVVQAEEETGESLDLNIPVEVQPGRTTVVHLEGDWRPAVHYTNAEVVRLPDGQIAGWRALPHSPNPNLTRTPS